jgi:hypothetical protein
MSHPPLSPFQGGNYPLDIYFPPFACAEALGKAQRMDYGLILFRVIPLCPPSKGERIHYPFHTHILR